MTYSTLTAAMKSNNPEIVSSREVNVQGNVRKMLRVRKANGKKVYMVVAYENGSFSSPVTY